MCIGYAFYNLPNKKTTKTVSFCLAGLLLEDNLLRTGHKLLTEIQPRTEMYNLQKSPLEKNAS